MDRVLVNLVWRMNGEAEDKRGPDARPPLLASPLCRIPGSEKARRAAGFGSVSEDRNLRQMRPGYSGSGAVAVVMVMVFGVVTVEMVMFMLSLVAVFAMMMLMLVRMAVIAVMMIVIALVLVVIVVMIVLVVVPVIAVVVRVVRLVRFVRRVVGPGLGGEGRQTDHQGRHQNSLFHEMCPAKLTSNFVTTAL
jgi:hypothetical protein